MSNESTTRAESTRKVINENDQTGGRTTAVDISTPESEPLPSACDILRPLSQIIGVPSSGYVAARAREMREGQYVGEKDSTVEHGTEDGSRNSASDSNSQTCTAGDHAGDDGVKKSEQNASNVTISSPSSSTESIGRTSTQTNDSDTENQESIQKRTETVQLVREVDSDGERTFVRRIVEYH